MITKRKLIDIVKNSKLIYLTYYYLISPILSIAGLFIKAQKMECLFVCYGGRKYGDNVRPIYLQMLMDTRFRNWKFIWAFRDPNEFELPDKIRTKKVKIDSLEFFYYALRARCWITNVSVQRGLSFKNRGTLYVNTWHGVPLKRIRCCVKDGFNVRTAEKFDLIFSEGTYDSKISVPAFQVKEKQIKITGYPRNDIMFDESLDLNKKVRRKYGLHDERIVLYAPTFRDYIKNDSGGFTFQKKLSPEKFQNTLGDQYKLLVRAHGAIEDHSTSDSSCVDVSDYPDVEDLLVAADILVSDYSGIIFDFSLLEKPIICFIYDLETYKKERGFFVDIEHFLPFKKCNTEEELYDAIKNIDIEESRNQARLFQKQCGLVKKGAAKNAVNEIYLALASQFK